MFQISILVQFQGVKPGRQRCPPSRSILIKLSITINRVEDIVNLADLSGMKGLAKAIIKMRERGKNDPRDTSSVWRCRRLR